jgi:hypothetical protein
MQEMNLVMTLLTQPQTTDPVGKNATIGELTLDPQTRLDIQTGDASSMLPLMLLFGGGVGGFGDSSTNPLLMILLLPTLLKGLNL